MAASYNDAISAVESGGRYGLLGPVTRSGDRAYGRYQVMGANVPEWTRAALGTSMTPAQFLASPQAQDAVFNHQFGQYVQKYGAEGAARAWFAGEGGMNDMGRRDVLGTSVADYARKFNTAMGGQQAAPVGQPGAALSLSPMAYANAQPAAPNLPLFAPQPAQAQPQAQAQQQPAAAAPAPSFWSMLAPPSNPTDLANFWARQNPTG